MCFSMRTPSCTRSTLDFSAAPVIIGLRFLNYVPRSQGNTPKVSGQGPNVAKESLVVESTDLDPPTGHGEDVAMYWTEVSAIRWSRAISAVRATGTALCDTDPLKLHYHYSLVQIGLLERNQLQADVLAARHAISNHLLGIADLIFCEIPAQEILEQRMESDAFRRRHRFDVHGRLGEPIQNWYQALLDLDPGRVQWGFPDVLPKLGMRDRYDVALFDAWMIRLGVA
jgi:hypothetical protein